MYLSKIIRSGSNVYIYDALKNSFARINSADDILDDGKYACFLENSNFRDIKKACEFDVRYPYKMGELNDMFTYKMKSMTLALTEQCNLRCKYCGYMPKYIDDDHCLKEMPRDVAFKAIDILMKSSHESELCHLGFYGGEPLLRLGLIKECIKYIGDEYPFRSPSYNITTNALLLDDEISDYIIENGIKVNISLDGPKDYQNKYRIDGNGNASYKKVIQNVQAFYQKNPQYFGENVTYNVVMYNGASDDLFEAVDGLWKSDVNMIDLFLTEHFINARDESDGLTKSEAIDIRKYSFAFKNMLKSMKKYYNSFNGLPGSNTIFPGGFCMPGVRKDFVRADGKIIVCERVDENQEVFEIGDVYSGIDIKKIERLVDKTLRSLEQCKDCWAAKFCKICFKDIFNISEDFCEKSRKDVESELGYYFDRICNDRELINYIANISII